MSRIASDEIKVRFNKRHKVSPHTSTVYELTKCLACTTRVVHGVVKDSSVVFVKLSGRSLSHDFFKAESTNLISLYPGERNLFLGLQVNRKKVYNYMLESITSVWFVCGLFFHEHIDIFFPNFLDQDSNTSAN